jgi:TolB-like protein/Flp pilus assembly protein TadD
MEMCSAIGVNFCGTLSAVLADHDQPGHPAARLLRFGPFELDTRAGELRKRGTSLTLKGQPLQVLEILLRHSGDIVTREELRAHLWTSDTFVDFEHSLHNAIARLRDTLGDSAAAPRFIQTLPRRGYRFVIAVESIDGEFGGAPTSRTTAQSRAPEIRALAVLPLVDLSGDPAQGYFADGMTEALITSLAKIGKLRVISRTSVMPYRATRKSLPRIARELNVDAVLEGSVLRSGERVRITAQLIHAQSDQHLWAESYERDLRDILGVQGDIAREVANQVRVMLTPEERARLEGSRPVDPQAHDLLLKARFQRNQRTEGSVKKALTYFQSAVEIDPKWAEGYVGIADCYNILAYYNGLAPKEAYSKSEKAARKALELDPSMGEAHAAIGVMKRDYEWDWAGAEQHFQRAIELNPGCVDAYHWRGTMFGMLGRHREALNEKMKALEMDPLSPVYRTDVGRLHYFVREYDLAIDNYRAALEADPNFFLTHTLLGQAYLQKGMFKPALTALGAAMRLTGDSAFALARLAHGQALAGDIAKARGLLRRLRETAKRKYVSPYDHALVLAGFGELKETLKYLERALEERSIWLGYLNVEPAFDALRGHRQFQSLLKRIGLV